MSSHRGDYVDIDDYDGAGTHAPEPPTWDPKCIPRPELIVPADWRVVESGAASVDLEGKVLFVPLDPSRDALSTRLHEYSHCRFSKGSASTAAKRAKVPLKVIQSVEDARVNLAYQMTCQQDRAGAGLPVLYWSDDLVAAAAKTCRTMADRVLLGISLLGSNSDTSFLNAEEANHVDCIATQFRRAMRVRGYYRRQRCATVRARNKIAQDVAKRLGFTTPPEEKKRRDAESESTKGLRREAVMRAMHDGCVTADELEKSLRRKSGHYGSGDVRYGDMVVITAPMPDRVSGRFTGKRWRASDEGAEIEYPERRPLDGRCFRMKAKGSGATILIDVSGSMSLYGSDVRAILEAAPGSVVAMYSGHCAASRRHDHETPDGQLSVVGRCKRAASEDWLDETMRIVGGGNIVDGPALRWLGRQRGPRIWVSDGQVTGLGDLQSAAIFSEAADIVGASGIIRIRDVAGALAWLRGRRLGGVRGRAAMRVPKLYLP
jgi:hypothetical protein